MLKSSTNAVLIVQQPLSPIREILQNEICFDSPSLTPTKLKLRMNRIRLGGETDKEGDTMC